MNSYTLFVFFVLFLFLYGPARSVPLQRQRQGQGRTETFYSQVMNTWRNVTHAFQIEWCFDNANEKIKSVATANADDFAAKVSMSMYSRLCKINGNRFTEDKTVVNFPMRLNKELRCEGMTKLRNPQVRGFFQKAGDIINRSLEKLRPRIFKKNLYRGVETFPYQNKTQFIEFGFFSASTSIKVALGFARGKILFIVEQMYGVYIANFAEDRFQYQKEVLAKSNTMFMIRSKETDKKSIESIVNKLYPQRNRPYPEVIIYISEVVNINDYNRQSVSLQQQIESYNFCRPS